MSSIYVSMTCDNCTWYVCSSNEHLFNLLDIIMVHLELNDILQNYLIHNYVYDHQQESI